MKLEDWMDQERKPKEKLLSEFPPTGESLWLAAAEKLLKGKPFDKVLRTSTYEGITLEPIYQRQVWERIAQIDELPGAGSMRRSSKIDGYQKEYWKIAQEIDIPLAEDFNLALLDSLQRGQDAINLLIDDAGLAGNDPDGSEPFTVGKNGTSISCLADMEKAFDGVRLDCVEVNIQAYNNAMEYAMLLAAYCQKRGIDIKEVKGCVGADPLGALAEKGYINNSLEVAYSKMAGLLMWAKETGSPLRTIDIHSYASHNAGGSAVEELSLAMSTAVEYIRAMQKYDLGIDDVAPRIQFSFAIGGNLFMEIAKFRAARMLWSQIVSSFGGREGSAKMYIHARSGKFNKSRNDPYVNMLRTTTEAFAGILGGVDSMHVSCFDEVISTSSDFSRRIARNQQIILREESHLGHVIDPAGGSWYIEVLTEKLATLAWKNFSLLEAEGSMSKNLQSGKIHDILDSISQARRRNLATRKDVMVGVNMYADAGEKPLPERQPDYAKISCRRSAEIKKARKNCITIEQCAHSVKNAWLAGASLGLITKSLGSGNITKINALPAERLSEPFEELRGRMLRWKKKNGRSSRVFLANTGDISQFKARAEFSRGFFEIGGFEVIDSGGYNSAEEAGKAAVASEAEIVIICSLDALYPSVVPVICKAVKAGNPRALLILAGYPVDQIEDHKKCGIQEFIHVKANVLEVLTNAQKSAGVEL